MFVPCCGDVCTTPISKLDIACLICSELSTFIVIQCAENVQGLFYWLCNRCVEFSIKFRRIYSPDCTSAQLRCQHFSFRSAMRMRGAAPSYTRSVRLDLDVEALKTDLEYRLEVLACCFPDLCCRLLISRGRCACRRRSKTRPFGTVLFCLSTRDEVFIYKGNLYARTYQGCLFPFCVLPNHPWSVLPNLVDFRSKILWNTGRKDEIFLIRILNVFSNSAAEHYRVTTLVCTCLFVWYGMNSARPHAGYEVENRAQTAQA